MTERATGLILRSHLLTETSLVVHWLTREHGRLATVAKGARRQQSPFRGKLDLYYAGEFSFARSRHSDLHTLREVTVVNTHEPLRRSVALLQQAAYAARCLEQVSESETPVPALHELLADFLDHLARQPAHPRLLLAFELKLLRELGLQPDPAQSHLTPETAQILGQLAECVWSELTRLDLDAAQVLELRRFLHGFLIYHLGKIPRGRAEAFGSGAVD